jgi:hypothetical protein
MPAQGISKIYLSISRGFHFNPQDKDLQSKYDFFADNRSYFDKVVKDVQYIGRRDLTIEKLGKMRSILDLSSNGCGADNFFQFFQDYYCNLATKGLYLIPHYPCVVDILPTADTQYGIDLSTFPESFRNATVAKISVSIRLYPIGLGSLKLGLYLQTKESFNIQDITELLRQKSGKIFVINLGEYYTIDQLTRVYAELLLQALFKVKKPFSWTSTYSFIDIIESEPLSLESNYEDFFLPITCLGKEPKNKEYVPKNQSLYGDILLFGEKSAVSYIPGAEDSRLMNPDRRKLRRWVRNSAELFSAQQFACNIINTNDIARTLDELRSQYWAKKLKDGVLPPVLEKLFSCWNITNLHSQGYPLCKENWRERHSELIRMLDQGNRIISSNKQAMEQLTAITEQASNAQHDVANALKTANDNLKDYLELMKSNFPSA